MASRQDASIRAKIDQILPSHFMVVGTEEEKEYSMSVFRDVEHGPDANRETHELFIDWRELNQLYDQSRKAGNDCSEIRRKVLETGDQLITRLDRRIGRMNQEIDEI